MQEVRVDQLVPLLSSLLGHKATESQIRLLLGKLQNLQLSHRKQLITLCRSCSIPPIDTILYSRCSEILVVIHEWDSTLQKILTDLITNPLYCGMIISLCISLPLSTRAIKDTYSQLFAKEVLVMESSPLPSALNYNPFFGSYQESIHPSVEPNPRMASAIHQLIDRWIESLERKSYILPHMTSKLCSKATQHEVAVKYPSYVTFEEEGATQADLEYIYMTEGDLLPGCPCEVKQRWYSSNLVPRTYYAAGSDAYHASKYVRDALNSLCDFLPPTERYARVNPHRIVLSSPQSHALIYDLTSFTSNMHEQRHFLSRLAMYCKGHSVKILDAVEGVVPVDLGDLLSWYNELNTQPSYCSDKLTGNLVLRHHVAGFLGVFGNLASCTFLHGAVMSQLVSTFSQLGVAGDDGLIESVDDFTTFFVIRLLGLCEESKGYSTSEDGWQVYLKRPIRQVGSRVFAESFALYSMFEHLFPGDDCRFFPVPRSKSERLSSLASSIVVYLRSLSRIALTDEERELVLAFLAAVYRLVHFPLSGNVPQIHSSHPPDTFIPSGVVPVLSIDAIGLDPIEFTIKSLYSSVAVIPERIPIRLDIDYDLCFAGSSFVCTGSPLLSYYRKLGFVELVQGDVVLIGEEGLHALLHYYSPARSFPVYTVNVLRDIPDHLLP